MIYQILNLSISNYLLEQPIVSATIAS